MYTVEYNICISVHVAVLQRLGLPQRDTVAISLNLHVVCYFFLRLTLLAACIAAALTGHKFKSSHPLVFLVHAFLWSPAVEPYRGILIIYLLYWYPCPVPEI
jgi:hypothetical protein